MEALHEAAILVHTLDHVSRLRLSRIVTFLQCWMPPILPVGFC
jgi:hypothetical protein